MKKGTKVKLKPNVVELRKAICLKREYKFDTDKVYKIKNYEGSHLSMDIKEDVKMWRLTGGNILDIEDNTEVKIDEVLIPENALIQE